MSTAIADASASLLGVYRPAEPVFVAGEGSSLITEDGERYLDFTSGIAVNALGYGDEDLSAAIREALDSGVIHTSNLFQTRPGAELARWLTDHSFAERVFFCNSGAEANEGAFKFARRWAREAGGDAKVEIIAFRGGFHGRTFGALAATDRPALQEPFLPLVPGFHFASLGQIAEVRALASRERTAAIIIEPLQGEGGVQPVSPEFLAALRELCDEIGALLIFDEVQVGLGRTGTLWAYEASGVVPDLLTVAKPLAGGLPMGAVLLSGPVAAAIRPGDHATTFGGGPLVASAALAVCRRVGSPDFLASVQEKGERIQRRLNALVRERPGVREARGAGMIWGLIVEEPAAEVVARALEARLLLCPAGANVVRLLPPLTISEEDLDRGLDILSALL